MLSLLKKFENTNPEIVFEWKDKESDAEGWIVINSLRGGAAGGGTRMRKGLDRREVESLAKTMEVKFTVSGPPIGGAKSGINFDPNDPRKKEVLKRWYSAVMPLLKNYYGTGGDLNVDEIHEVIPITEEFGLWHPQEGVVNGHFSPKDSDKIHKIGQLRYGVSKVLEDTEFTPDPSKKFVVADMITGYGVSESIRHYYTIYGGSLSGKKVIVQGWGNVAAAAAWFLSKNGASVVGVIDRNGGLVSKVGFSFDEINELFLNKNGNALVSKQMIPFDEINESIWDLPADVFIPCAASRLVTQNQMERLINSGLKVVSCGANVPFSDPEIFYGNVTGFVDSQISLIPDFIANCGMARVFAYLMGRNVEMSDKAIFQDTSETIQRALKNVHALNPNTTGLTETAFQIALKQLVKE
jgi:glutamate dehydrogenase/leucine dehydrogenase